MKSTKFQVMPPLSSSQYADLKTGIEKHGVLVAVKKSFSGETVDGFTREEIAGSLGIAYPIETLKEEYTDEELFELAVDLNMNRRHLTKDERDELIVKLRDRGLSFGKIAKATQTPKTTVQDVVARAQPEQDQVLSGGRNRPPDKTTGQHNKDYPAKITPPGLKRTRSEQVQNLVKQGRTQQQVAKQLGVSQPTVSSDLKSIPQVEDDRRAQKEAGEVDRKLIKLSEDVVKSTSRLRLSISGGLRPESGLMPSRSDTVDVIMTEIKLAMLDLELVSEIILSSRNIDNELKQMTGDN